ncbi:glucosyltransferase domain-containing protein [Budvicia diplopodorum]|uniref:glucosyltransferase domain-containing protein n=1 Tax=Budvicia diplopodorum TaxID=1119056 RepID=UPI00135BD3EE|nr:glucosyltransferase domain-containing protein [Budvicia diplopodorum]
MFLFTLAFALFISVPLWSNKNYYGDDFMRLYTGEGIIWTSNGRPLTSVLHYFLTFSTTLNDISPVPLLAGLAVLSFSAALFVYSLRLNLPFVLTVLLSVGIVANPFLAQPMLYIWDSVSILGAFSLAMLAAIPYSSRPLKYFFITAVLLLSMLMFYQIAINLYLSCVIITAYCLILRQQPVLRFMIAKICALVPPILIYKFIIAPAIIADSYSLTSSQLIAPGIDAIAVMQTTLLNFVTLLQTTFPGWKMVFVALPALLTFLCIIHKIKHLLSDKTQPHRIAVAVFYLLSPILVIMMLPGVSILLNNAVVAPRTMPAFSTVTLFFMIVLFSTTPRWLHSTLFTGFIASLMYTSVMMVAIFNTMIKEQDYLSSVAWMIKADLSRVRDVENVTFLSVLRTFPDTTNSRQAFPLIDAVSPAVSSYTYPYFFQSRNVGLPIIKPTSEIRSYRPAEYISKNCDYRLFTYQKTAVVDFSDGC